MATDKLVCAGASENVVVVELCKNANMASIGMIIFTTSQNHKELYDKGFFSCWCLHQLKKTDHIVISYDLVRLSSINLNF